MLRQPASRARVKCAPSCTFPWGKPSSRTPRGRAEPMMVYMEAVHSNAVATSIGKLSPATSSGTLPSRQALRRAEPLINA